MTVYDVDGEALRNLKLDPNCWSLQARPHTCLRSQIIVLANSQCGTWLVDIEANAALDVKADHEDIRVSSHITWSMDGQAVCMPVLNWVNVRTHVILHLGWQQDSGTQQGHARLPTTRQVPLNMRYPEWTCFGSSLHDPHDNKIFHAHSFLSSKKRGRSHMSHAFSLDGSMLIVVAGINMGAPHLREPASEVDPDACMLEHYQVSWEPSSAPEKSLMRFKLTAFVGRFDSVLDAGSVAWNPSLISPRMYGVSDLGGGLHLVDARKHRPLCSWSAQELFGHLPLTAGRDGDLLKLMWCDDGRMLICIHLWNRAILSLGG